MIRLGKYFEKRQGIIWGIVTIILFLFVFGGFDLIFKLVYVNIDFQNPALNWFKGLIIQDLPNFYRSNFFLLIIAFVIVLVIGTLIWKFGFSKPSEKKETAESI